MLHVGTGPAECEECFCGIYHLSQIGEHTGVSRGWRYISDGVTRTYEKDKYTIIVIKLLSRFAFECNLT